MARPVKAVEIRLQTVTIRLDPWVIQGLSALSESRGMTRTQLIRADLQRLVGLSRRVNATQQ